MIQETFTRAGSEKTVEIGSRDSYASAVGGLHEFGSWLEGALKASLGGTPVVVHAIPWRVKSRESAARRLLKIGKSDDEYSSLYDLLGMRVITLFESDLDQVAVVVEELLEIDKIQSSDKRERYKTDQFGYRSRHFVGCLSESRRSLPENATFRDKTVEIQIRSVLQHAWAEIEHDLGYKPSRPLADDLRRKFSQLAAVMELADDQFSGLRSAVEEVESEQSGTEPNGLMTEGLSVAKLSAFVRSNDAIRALDKTIATVLSSAVLPAGKDYRTFVGYLLDICASVNWLTIEEIANSIDAAAGNGISWGRSLTPDERLAIESVGHGLRPGFSLIVAARRMSEKRKD